MDEIENTEEVESTYEPPFQVEPPTGPIDITADEKWREKAELEGQINSQYQRAEKHQRYGDTSMEKVALGVARSLEKDLKRLNEDYPHPGVKQAIESETTAHERQLAAVHESREHFEEIRSHYGDEKTLRDINTRCSDTNQNNYGKTAWIWCQPGDSVVHGRLDKPQQPVPIDCGSIELADRIRREARFSESSGKPFSYWDALKLRQRSHGLKLPETKNSQTQKEYEKTRPQPVYHSPMKIQWGK